MNDAKPLKSQVAVVTGGSRGIGFAIANKLSSLGSKVLITGRDRAALNKAESEIRHGGGHIDACQFDVTSLADVEELSSYVMKQYGQIDTLVNNAGVGIFGQPLHETAPADWDTVVNTNLRGVYFCIRAFAPMMIARKGGHIINISSIASKNPVPNAAAYAATKWGLNGLTYSVAEELRNYNIRVSLVCPGSTNTELRRQGSGDVEKMLDADDIAHVVAMLVTQAPQSFASEVIIRPTRKP